MQAMSIQSVLITGSIAERDVRASIVAWLDAEAARYDATIDQLCESGKERVRIKAGMLRTISARIANGDDRAPR